MLKYGISALILGASALMPQQASAAVIAYEGFDYADGTALNGQKGGQGWAAGWVIGDSARVLTRVENGVLYAYNKYKDNTGANPTRALSYTPPTSGGVATGTVYIMVDLSNIYNVEANYTLRLYNGTKNILSLGQGRGGENWYTHIYASNGSGGTVETKLTSDVNSRTNDGIPNVGRLVVAIDYDNYMIRFYVNPDLLDEEPLFDPTAYQYKSVGSVGFANFAELTSISLYTSNQANDYGWADVDNPQPSDYRFGNGVEKTWDNIAFVTEWSDLATLVIPEPSSILYGIGGVMTLLGLHRRRSKQAASQQA